MCYDVLFVVVCMCCEQCAVLCAVCCVLCAVCCVLRGVRCPVCAVCCVLWCAVCGVRCAFCVVWRVACSTLRPGNKKHARMRARVCARERGGCTKVGFEALSDALDVVVGAAWETHTHIDQL